MYASFHRHQAAPQSPVRWLGVAMLSVALAVLMAVLSATPASATPSKSSVVAPATVSALPSNEVEELLAGIPLSELNSTELTEALSKLPSLSTVPTDKLQEALSNAVISLTNKNATVGGLLDQTEIVPLLEAELKKLLLPTELLSLLKGGNLNTKLNEALGSLDPSELLDMLLNSSGTPEQLLTQLFAKLNPEPLLGTTLTGEPFSKTTVSELAGELGMTPATLAEELNISSAQLPEDAAALTTPLSNGKTLGVLNGLDSVTLGLLGKPESNEDNETKDETGKETSKESNNSENGTTTKEGAGNGSALESPGTTTVVVNVPSGQSALTPTSKANATKKSEKIKIVGHRVKGTRLTIVVRVPAAGQLALTGKGVTSVRRQTAKAERVTLRTTLTKVDVASLRRHPRKLRIKLDASFKVVGGSSSSARLTVDFN